LHPFRQNVAAIAQGEQTRTALGFYQGGQKSALKYNKSIISGFRLYWYPLSNFLYEFSVLDNYG